MRIETAFSAFAAAFLLVPGALAADWQKVAAAGNEQVDIDKTRIMRTSPGQTVAWTRLTLGRELKDAGGSYTAVQAMNRYDCNSGKFVTLRRVYMKGELAVREEQITSPKEVFVAANSLDERLMNEACKLRTVGEAHQTAAAAAAAAAAVAAAGAAQAQEGKPGVMYADVRALADEPKVHAVPVADTAAQDAVEEGRPKSAADTKIEIRSPSERPRFIGLPKMEKPPSPEEPKAAEGKVAEPAPTAKAPSNDDPIPIANVSRQERERLLATSGPRRATARPAKREADPAPAYRRDVRWGYEGEGAPANWARLRPEYATCSTGKRQSPIDIRDGIKVDLEPIQFNYGHSYVRIADTGSTLQVNVGEGSSITVTGRTYQLQQFHFTRPSEERINGKAYEMSLHLVHRDSDGRMAIIAILLDRGQENPLIQTLWNNMPLEVNQDVVPGEAIDLKSLLPDNRAYYTYMGSLTTPPCTEDVLWMVLKQPIAISADQVAIFSRLYRNNARPIQPSNNRLIKENR